MKLRVPVIIGAAALASVAALQSTMRAAAVPVQTPPSAKDVLVKNFAEVSDWITRSAALVPADKYSYRPVGTVRTFGQLVAHVADAYTWYCGSAKAGKNLQWADPIEKAGGDKAALTAKLKAATDACKAVYGTATTANMSPLVGNIGHSNLHYGNMITYMRMLGLVPPSS